MPKYLGQGNYITKGLEGLMAKGAVGLTVAAAGG